MVVDHVKVVAGLERIYPAVSAGSFPPGGLGDAGEDAGNSFAPATTPAPMK